MATNTPKTCQQTKSTQIHREVYPHNFAERVYAIFVLLFALVTFSSFVSSMTSRRCRGTRR